MGLTLTGTPLVTARFPGVIVAEPLTKSAVSAEEEPATMLAGFAVKLEMDGTRTVGPLEDEPPQPVRPTKPRQNATAHTIETADLFMVFLW